MEDRLRSLVKGLSWRAIASLCTIVLVFLFTGSLSISIGLGLIDIVIKLMLYYFHERIWLKIKWGTKKEIKYGS